MYICHTLQVVRVGLGVSGGATNKSGDNYKAIASASF